MCFDKRCNGEGVGGGGGLGGREEGEWSLQRRMKEGTKWRLLLKVAAALLCCFSRFATFKMAPWDKRRVSCARRETTVPASTSVNV